MQGVLKVAQGSSPRVRGTPARYRRRSSRPGIIPACAGNTSPGVVSPLHDRDHPRVCGEHRGQHGLQPVRPGSSPRVRGTPMTWAQIDDVAGIIPACAGNTCLDIALFVVHWDHPRVCGEHLRFNGIRCLGKGSSPRVRGTRLWWFSCSVLLGIIPACAGNTNRLAVRRPAWRDHPRVCGEHAWQCANGSTSMGSSPRVRGTLTSVGNLRNVQGIIPACAGNTKRTNISSCVNWDHPRVCGEHTS